MYTNDWIIQEFSRVPFGDDRLVNRLINIVECFYQKPEGSIPSSCNDYASTKATYRFFDNKNVSPEAITMTHSEETIERIRKNDVVLVIQDSTSLNFTDHPCTEGLGNIGYKKESLGLMVHTALAVNVKGVPLGILSQDVWARDTEDYGKKHTRKKRSTSDKESNKWLNALDSSLKGVSKYTTTVTVCDREADIYDFFNKAVKEERHLLVRAVQNRKILESGEYLKQEIARVPAMGEIIIDAPRNPEKNQPARTATLSIKYCPVTIKPPVERKNSEDSPNIKLHLVCAEETNPPQGVEPIHWLLLTTLPVTTMDEAAEKIKWYKQRWKIERYHFVLKSGCKVEELQLQNAENLEKALAIYSIIAWKLLWIKLESENNPEELCDIVLQEYEWQALYCAVNRGSKPPMQPPTLKEAVLLIAKLGGFLGRKSDGNPGLKTIWRGLTRLHDISEGWLIARS